MAEKFVLVSALETLNKGDVFVEWPLHVTILPWFTLPTERQRAFENALTNRTHDVASIHTIGGEEAFFGPRQDARVRKLRRIGALASLHQLALETVRSFDGSVDDPYIERNYEPHVTFQDEKGIEEGQEVTLTALQLVRGEEAGRRTVQRVFYFGKEE